MGKEDKSLMERAADYYRGERISNSLLFLIGGGALVWTLSIFLWRQGTLSQGMFVSTLPFAFFFLISGGYRFARSMKRYDAIKATISGEKYLLHDEYDHLMGRAERFRKKRKVDFIGILTGFSIIFFGVTMQWNHILVGTAISITFASVVLLIFDLFGQFRTEEMLHFLNKYKR